jgi:hypothetical protein
MTASRDPDRLIHAFLHEGDEELQDQVYDAVRAAIEQKRQRVVFGPWRTPTMNKFVTIGLGAAAVVVLLLVGVQLFGSPSGNTGGPAPEPTLTPEPSVAPERSVDAGLPVGTPLAWLDSSEGGVPITMTIPAPGWNGDLPGFAFAKNESADPPDGAAMFAFSGSEGWTVPADACDWESTMPETPSATVDDLVAALSAQASRDASVPTDITVGGHAGVSITLHVPDPMPADCDQDLYCMMAIPGMSGPHSCERNAQGPGQIDELWIVAVDGIPVVIDAAYYEGTPAEYLEEMQAIVDSITFEAP